MLKKAEVYGSSYDKMRKQFQLGKTPIAMFVNEIQNKSKVLEFGPASGYMTRYLKEENK